jgi:hypothetical protein
LDHRLKAIFDKPAKAGTPARRSGAMPSKNAANARLFARRREILEKSRHAALYHTANMIGHGPGDGKLENCKSNSAHTSLTRKRRGIRTMPFACASAAVFFVKGFGVVFLAAMIVGFW